jgi:hypothetical protein
MNEQGRRFDNFSNLVTAVKAAQINSQDVKNVRLDHLIALQCAVDVFIATV